MIKSLVRLLKKLPIDLGQADNKHTTKGKQIALELVGDATGDVLDVGCRDGYFSQLFERKGCRLTSIDIERSYAKCDIVDANDPLPYPNNSFDLIWCSEVIEHLENPGQVIEEFRRVLKPHGKAVLTTPNSQFWLYGVLKPFGLTPQKLQNPTHLHFFGLDDLKKFSPTNIYGFFPYMILKFKITRFLNFLTPTFVFQVTK